MASVPFNGNATGSLRALLDAASRLEDVWDSALNATTETARCARYGFPYDGRAARRRIFYGSLVADDSWHTIGIAAMEAYGVFDTVALVESNATQMRVPRELRFRRGSNNTQLLKSGMWGPATRVTVDYFLDDPLTKNEDRKGEEATGLERENLQRDAIVKRWRTNGMTEDDIGLIADVDEVATRDFLRALQICDVPEFRKGQDCKKPKVLASTLVFEGSPGCVQDGRRWYHPDFIIGECVEGIGDRQKHGPQNRSWVKYGYVVRPDSSDWENSNRTMFPLWEATDFRMGSGGGMVSGEDGLHTAFHLHNFFDSLEVLRRKYKTYGHPDEHALDKQMSLIQEGDVGFMVDCLMDRNETDNEWKRTAGGWKSIERTRIPVAFQKSPRYAELRHAELQHMMADDEKRHPRDPSLEHLE